MNSVINTYKTVIPNIQHQTHKLAVLSKVTGNTTCTSTTGERERGGAELDMTQFMQEAWFTVHMKMVFML
jgi:hypothetical protein